MRLQKDTWRYFGEEIEGVVLDNAYDEYNKNAYKKHIAAEDIRYVCARDTDMRVVALFEELEFLKIPPEAENLECLQALKRLKGIWICGDELEKIRLSWFPALEKLVVFEESCFKRRRALKSSAQGERYVFTRCRRNEAGCYEAPFEWHYFVKRKS